MAMPEVGLPVDGVPQTTTPRSGGGDVDRGVAQAGGDEELQIRQLLDHGAGERGALAHGADDLEALQRLDDVVPAAQMLVEHLDVEVACDLRPVGDFERNGLVVVEDRAAAARHGEYPWLAGSSAGGCRWIAL
jgi:hypothetical protein